MTGNEWDLCANERGNVKEEWRTQRGRKNRKGGGEDGEGKKSLASPSVNKRLIANK